MALASTDTFGLAALVFVLGLRHGFDPDHLVAIDGLARASAHTRPGVARWSGLFFSLGHGVVVTAVGVTVALAAVAWRAPQWLEHLGAAISIGVLLVLGIANLLALARTARDRPVILVGLRGRWLVQRFAGANHPIVMASVGAAFALSFDTISHALLFSVTGAAIAGAVFAALLGGVFTLGMLLTDALNGWWVARLIAGADRRAAIASRVLSVVIALLCLALATIGCTKVLLPMMQERMADIAAPVSAGVIVTLLVSYLVANRFAARVRAS
jgi:high-affinity nickel-transport protein